MKITGEDLQAKLGDSEPNRGDLLSNRGDLSPNRGDLPEKLIIEINKLTPKARKLHVRIVILKLLLYAPCSAEALSNILNKKMKSLKGNHLSPLREEGLINYLYPEVINHPGQAYVITDKGRKKLKRQA